MIGMRLPWIGVRCSFADRLFFACSVSWVPHTRHFCAPCRSSVPQVGQVFLEGFDLTVIVAGLYQFQEECNYNFNKNVILQEWI